MMIMLMIMSSQSYDGKPSRIPITFRIIATIQAHDFIDHKPQPTTRSSSARRSIMDPNIHPITGKMNSATPPKRPKKTPRNCKAARRATPSGLSLVGDEYPVVGVGISAI
jgi:hypothetical protein